MANLSENYDKASLIISILLATALGALILMAQGQVEDDFEEPSRGNPGADSPENPRESFYAGMSSQPMEFWTPDESAWDGNLEYLSLIHI